MFSNFHNKVISSFIIAIFFIAIISFQGVAPRSVYASTSSGVLKVEFFNSNTSSSNNSINPCFKITNTGSSPLNLSTVKLRYYYTIDDTVSQQSNCDYSSVQDSNVITSFTSLGQTYSNADYYFEIGFTAGAGTLDPGANVELQFRINKSNWTNYVQTNDYSFNSSASTYTVWNYVTGYINNTLVWGIEPNSSSSTQPPVVTPTPTPVVNSTNSNHTGTFSRIEAENYSNINGNSIKQITVPNGLGLGYINEGDYAVYNNINFGQGASLFKAKLASEISAGIEIRIGNENGTLIGYLSFSPTGSWDNYQEFSCNISNTTKGTNNICLVFKGSVNVDWFGLSGISNATSTPAPTPTATPVPSNRSAFVEIQAENYDYSNAQYIQSIGISGGGTAVGYLLSGDYIVFNNVNFSSESNSFKARVAAGNATSMEIRADSTSGPLLAAVNIPSTGDWSNYQEVSCTTTNISGTKKLYFIFNGPINFDWFVFLPKSNTEATNAFSRIEAKNFSGISSSNIKTVGNIVCYIQSGNYIVFNNVDFKSGAKSFKLYAANASGSTTDIEIRVGNSTGTYLGTLSVPSTSSWDEFKELTCNINTITGKQNLYLVFNGPVNVDWFAFSESSVVPTTTPTPTITPMSSPTANPAATPASSAVPTASTAPASSATPTTPVVPTPTIAIPTPAKITIDQSNIQLLRNAPQRAELASVQTISSTQDGELTLNGFGVIQGEKEVLLLVDNAISNEYIPTNILTPLNFAIFANNNLRGVGDDAKVIGNMHANNKLESYIADLKVSGVVSASTITIGYGAKFEGSTSTVTSPLQMPKFHDKIIAEIVNEDYKFYPSEFPDILDKEFPNQPGFHIRYEHDNNTFVITGGGTFNLESSMYFDGNLRISVPHIINTNSNFLVAEGFISLEGHDINPAELDETSINNTTNILNIYSIHGRIFVTTSSSKIYGVLYAAGEEDPTGKYTNDVGVVVMQGINTDIYGCISAGSDVRIEGSSSRYIYVSEISSKVESKYLPTASTISAKEAAQQIVDLFDGTNTKMYALQYSDKAYVDMDTFRFFDLSSDVNESDALKAHINSFPENESGFCNMGDALRRGKELLTHPTKSSADATKYIIVLAANSANKWTSSIEPVTGEAIGIEGDGTIDADGNALNYAVEMATSVFNSGIKTVFVNSSAKDISASIESVAVASGAPAVNGDKHYYTSAFMVDYSPVYKYYIMDPPKNAYIKNAVYSEIFPEGIQIVEKPSGSHVDIVEGTKREKLTIDNLNIKLTHDGTKYIIEPFTIDVKVRAKKLGNITFSGSDSKILYSIEYVDIDGNTQTEQFEKHFNDLTLNVYMSIDIG